MGLIETVLGLVFGGGRNAVAETAEVFRVNAEKSDERAAELQGAALAQLAAEFKAERKGWYDRLIDGLNRVPRPAMALGTLGLFVAAMVDPIWFSERMQGIALVPEPLWWLLGAIVSFYFGARHQAKGQEFHRSIAATMARTPQVVGNLKSLRALEAGSVGVADTGHDAGLALQVQQPEGEPNPALREWQEASHGR
ncbi:holin family protein [Roseovarius atlanticus]|uniref:holin family protein n=1 Tax=Roseovarius atlanticus TaxID=1641875 RepID=UPI001C957244|nr:holin family protein [Roseovarius atlanticus]MBY5988517.1 holin family protein [Roseovarius atlanticus]MBY6123908.1 holin family protein [Roseovarius atlanticus]MBY6148403.1 holin family protein [Roseovarius atlanticus]